MIPSVTTQSGLKSTKRLYNDVDLFQGILKLDDANIAQYDPFYGGYGRFFWVKEPPFVKLGNPDLWTRFANLTEKGSTSFDGINDLQANTEDMQGGMAGNSFKMVTGIKEDFDTFTIKCYELQGSPLREALQYWLSGIYDPKSGYASYNGLLDKFEEGFSARNHTGEIIYVVTDPTGRAKGVEYACYITNIVPTKVPKSHLNITHGDHPVVQMDIEFTGVKYESTYINEIACKILSTRVKMEYYSDFKPEHLTA